MICSRFSCTPSQAEEQPWPLTLRVMQVDDAHQALHLFNAGPKEREFLGQQPHLLRALNSMKDAQAGLVEE